MTLFRACCDGMRDFLPDYVLDVGKHPLPCIERGRGAATLADL